MKVRISNKVYLPGEEIPELKNGIMKITAPEIKHLLPSERSSGVMYSYASAFIFANGEWHCILTFGISKSLRHWATDGNPFRDERIALFAVALATAAGKTVRIKEGETVSIPIDEIHSERLEQIADMLLYKGVTVQEDDHAA